MQLLKYIGQFLLFHVNSVVNLPLWSCRASTPQEDMLAARDLSQPPRSTLSKGSTRRGPGLKTVGPRWVNDESRWVMPLSWWLFGIVLARSSIFPRPWPQNSLGAVTLMAIGHFAIAGQSYLKSAMDRWGPLKSVNLKNLLNTNHMLATSLDHSERWWHILFVFVCHMSEFFFLLHGHADLWGTGGPEKTRHKIKHHVTITHVQRKGDTTSVTCLRHLRSRPWRAEEWALPVTSRESRISLYIDVHSCREQVTWRHWNQKGLSWSKLVTRRVGPKL